jgi:histidine triad (HIT) family protein
MAECIFCRIIKKEIPSKIAAESTEVLAFYDVNPQAPIHVLVVSKEHISSVMELESKHSELLGEMVQTAQRVAKSEGIDRSGFRLVFNNGPDAGQAVDHLHLHLLGKRKLGWPPG